MAGVQRRWPLIAAAAMGATGVMAGAFGAHGLKGSVEPRLLDVWSTAADYQLLHAIALLALALYEVSTDKPSRFQWSLLAWIVGTLVFSGSLYALVLTGIGWLGAITPLGGTLLIAGWLLLLRPVLASADS